MSELTVPSVVAHLERFAKERRLMPGFKPSRDELEIELHGHVLDHLGLGEGVKAKVAELLAKRMRLDYADVVASRYHKLSLPDVHVIFRDFSEQLQEHGVHRLGLPRERVTHLRTLAELFLERHPSEKRRPRASGSVLVSFPKDSEQKSILSVAQTLNEDLLNSYLGPHAKPVLELLDEVRRKFLQSRYPVHDSDLLSDALSLRR
ncbi:hypothetical protein HY572_02500 [Candidatus Micrarchaeota archaeon]|nr:hypothetical protein [Candidatus Micrarchaeota archaeon]